MTLHFPLLLMCVSLLAATPAAAQKRATFIKGTFTDSATSCQRLQDIKAGRVTANAYSTPNSITLHGVTSPGEAPGRYKSITALGPKRWRVVIAAVDGGVPLETTVIMVVHSADKLVIRVTETALFWPAALGRGALVPGQPQWRVVREPSSDTATWQRCRI